MTGSAPRVTIARPSRSNGVLPIPASATQKRTGPAPEGPVSRAPLPRLKIIIRRLPPGLTQSEFEEALGDDWKAHGNKVNWAVYKEGKVSRDPAKPSRPSRAYLHLAKQEHIDLLAEKVHDTTFSDAKGSLRDSALLGPPSIEFAPYGRVPNSRPRKDARQSTIDQDQDFIDFLQSLTTPTSKPTPVDQENDGAGKGKEKVTITPLVQFLKDKKANKGKENLAVGPRSAKHTRQDSKDSKTAAIIDSKSASGSATNLSPKKRSAQALKVEQVARDAVKVLNKQAAISPKAKASTSQSEPSLVSTAPAVTPNNTANTAVAERRRERGNASAAARILQRDLGLAGNAGGRGGRRGTPGIVARPSVNNATTTAKPVLAVSEPVAATNADISTKPPAGTPDAPASTKADAAKSPAVPPAGPAAARAPPKAPASADADAKPSITSSISSKPAPSSSATQAFLKHANPSQGITEPLLEEAFAGFGAVNKVEIDKKKGFAYIDFAESESLQNAIKASPIKVAQGQVVVLERKTGSTLQARNARGPGPGMGIRGGSISMGGRGGPMRGRGGFSRGSPHLHHSNTARAKPVAANVAANLIPTASATTAALPPSIESSATPAEATTPAPTSAFNTDQKP